MAKGFVGIYFSQDPFLVLRGIADGEETDTTRPERNLKRNTKFFLITYNAQPYRRKGSGGTCFAGVCGQDDHSGAPRDGFMASGETGAPRHGFTG